MRLSKLQILCLASFAAVKTTFACKNYTCNESGCTTRVNDPEECQEFYDSNDAPGTYGHTDACNNMAVLVDGTYVDLKVYCNEYCGCQNITSSTSSSSSTDHPDIENDCNVCPDDESFNATKDRCDCLGSCRLEDGGDRCWKERGDGALAYFIADCK